MKEVSLADSGVFLHKFSWAHLSINVSDKPIRFIRGFSFLFRSQPISISAFISNLPILAITIHHRSHRPWNSSLSKYHPLIPDLGSRMQLGSNLVCPSGPIILLDVVTFQGMLSKRVIPAELGTQYHHKQILKGTSLWKERNKWVSFSNLGPSFLTVIKTIFQNSCIIIIFWP